MKRVLGIDFGLKRVGIAVTDPLQIAVHGLDTVPSEEIREFLKDYLQKEPVETIVVGDPFTEKVFDDQLEDEIDKFMAWLKLTFPSVRLDRQDEAYSSVQARRAILASGAGRKKRQDKALVDRISAVLILQQYLGHL